MRSKVKNANVSTDTRGIKIVRTEKKVISKKTILTISREALVITLAELGYDVGHESEIHAYGTIEGVPGSALDRFDYLEVTYTRHK